MGEGIGNYRLKDEIKAYWSQRAASFDRSAGHRIADATEERSWQRLLRDALGDLGRRKVLDLACGTGEISRMLLALGAEVTGVDFAEPMLARARLKNGGGAFRARIADVEALVQEGDAGYDAAVARHLVWTLVDPDAAFAEWRRVLKPGGRLLVIDGDFVGTPPVGRVLRGVADRFFPRGDDHGRGIDPDAHQRILREVHYRDGLTAGRLRADLGRAGFVDVRRHPIRRVYLFGMRHAPIGERLRLLALRRFALSAARPP